MKTLNPAWVEAVRRRWNTSPYLLHLSMKLAEVAWANARVEIPLAKKHLQLMGIVHGGVFSSLIDATCYWALYTMTPPGIALATVELKVNYLAPAQEGRLIGLGRGLKVGGTLGLAEARVEDEKGQLLAHGTSTIMLLKRRKVPLPEDELPKYLD